MIFKYTRVWLSGCIISIHAAATVAFETISDYSTLSADKTAETLTLLQMQQKTVNGTDF